MEKQGIKSAIGATFLIIALIFVYRSFYMMRIPEERTGTEGTLVLPHTGHHKH